MIIKATQNYTRQSPRKVRLVANAVKKLPLEKAFAMLAVIEKKATQVVTKTMQQAVANAMHNHGFALSDLTLTNILVTEGPRYKRFRAVSRGRAHNIVKKTCHVTVVLSTKEVAVETVPAAVTKEVSNTHKTETTKKSVKKKETAPKAAAKK